MKPIKLGFILDPHISSTTPSGRYDDYWETIYGKLEAVISMGTTRHWDALVISGDVYNTKQMPFPKQNRLIALFRDAPFDVFVIVGNHDIYYERLDTLKDTPLGNLLESGAVKMISQYGEFGGILTGASYSPDTAILPAPVVPAGFPKILVCHAYMGPKRAGFKGSAGGWLLYPEVIEAGYDIVVAGHDHTEYPTKVLENGCTVFRFGSLSRGTSHEHNLHREPKALEISCSASGWKHELLVVPHKPSEQVFAYTDIATKEEQRDMKHFIQELKALSTQELSSGNMSDLITQLEIPEDVLSVINTYATDFGIILFHKESS